MGEGLPDGFEIRFANQDDNDQLVAVSRSARIRLGATTVVIDPGDDYFTSFRLMDEWTALVVTHDDRVVGVQCACSFPGTYEGEPCRISQIIHTRFDPEYARMGLWSHLQSRMITAGRERAASFAKGEARALASDAPLAASDVPAPTKLVGIAYVAVENETVKRLYAGVKPWRAQPLRVTIPCAKAAAEGTARPARPSDAEYIVDVLNRSHEREELHLPYTASSLQARLERAPDLYSWQDVLIGDGAVLGVWHSPELRVRTDGETTTRSRRALVLDYGFLPGSEDAFEALVRQAAARSADAGYDHLSIFTSDAARGSARLKALGDRVEGYDVIVPFTGEPEGAAERGIYVDQVYF